jgi:hypothetical protein
VVHPNMAGSGIGNVTKVGAMGGGGLGGAIGRAVTVQRRSTMLGAHIWRVSGGSGFFIDGGKRAMETVACLRCACKLLWNDGVLFVQVRFFCSPASTLAAGLRDDGAPVLGTGG